MMQIEFSFGCYPKWKRGGLAIRENGARLSHHVLDVTVTVWKCEAWFTVRRLGRLALLTRWLPEGARGRGYCIGWLPRGAED